MSNKSEKDLKVSMLNVSDIHGGAARAAYRIHHALRRYGVDSNMFVQDSAADDWTVLGPKNKLSKVINKVRFPLARTVNMLLHTENPTLHSSSIIPSGWSKLLDSIETDVAHLHWVNNEMMSVRDIGNIRKPMLWTFHDMWAFCGGEHYTEDRRWIDGYMKGNRPSYESGFDLNRWVWKRKSHYWKKPMQIVTPSNWLGDCVRKSKLMHDWPVTVIPNAIDTDVWCPVDRMLARQMLGLPVDIPLLLFGAMGGTIDRRKGYDLLRDALMHLHGEIDDLQLVVFGQIAPKEPENLGFPVHYMGHLHDDVTLKLLYSAADVMVIPSRQDNLPNTGVESLSCGTPVVAFNTCGLPDIVSHKKTGYLAKSFDTEDLAHGIKWLLSNSDPDVMRRSSREHAVKSWSYENIAQQYINIYRKIIS